MTECKVRFILFILIYVISGNSIKAETSEAGANEPLTLSNYKKKLINDHKVVDVYIVDPLSNYPILEDTPVDQIKTIGNELSTNVALGEYEPLSFVIRTDLPEKRKINVEISPLKRFDTELSTDNINIYFVKNWYQAKEAWKEIARVKSVDSQEVELVPELLLKDEQLIKVDHITKVNYLRINTKGDVTYLWKGSKKSHTKTIINLDPGYSVKDSPTLESVMVPKNKNKQFWVTVYVPQNTIPGDYSGTLKVVIDDKYSVDVPLVVTVLPFELDDPKLEYVIYYHGRLHHTLKESLSSEYKSPVQLRIELLDLMQHGFNNPVIYQNHYKSTELFKMYMSMRQEIGMDNSRLYLMWLNTENISSQDHIKKIKRDIARLKKVTIEYGSKEIYVYGRDEAKGEKLLEQKAAWEAIRSADVKIYAAGYKGTFEAVGDQLDLFVLAKSPMQEEAKKFHRLNRKIFSYANPQSGIENPYIYRRNYGVVLWASEFDGAMIYAYQHSMGDAWNDSDHYKYRDHNFTYPVSNGVIGTIAWEGMREAIDDVRYINTLEKYINKQKSNNDLKIYKMARNAENYLDSIRKHVLKYNRYGEYTAAFYIDLRKMRNTIIDYILKLEFHQS